MIEVTCALLCDTTVDSLFKLDSGVETGPVANAPSVRMAGTIDAIRILLMPVTIDKLEISMKITYW